MQHVRSTYGTGTDKSCIKRYAAECLCQQLTVTTTICTCDVTVVRDISLVAAVSIIYVTVVASVHQGHMASVGSQYRCIYKRKYSMDFYDQLDRNNEIILMS